jgi:hypothetical protein
VRVGNRWEVGTVKAVYTVHGRNKYDVLSKKTNMVYVFWQGSTHLARYQTFTRETKVDANDVLNLARYRRVNFRVNFGGFREREREDHHERRRFRPWAEMPGSTVNLRTMSRPLEGVSFF